MTASAEISSLRMINATADARFHSKDLTSNVLPP
jgi:hypothetical protein